MKRNLFVSTIVAIALAVGLGGCLYSQAPLTDLQGQPLAQPRPIESLGELRVGGGKAPAPNQSYLAKQMQTRLAACIASVVHELSDHARWTATAWQVPDNVLWQPIGWRIGHQHFDYRPVVGSDDHLGPYASVTFSNARWDPTYSEVNYGPKKIAQDVKVSNSGKTKLIQNDSDAYVHVAYTESESITNAFSSTVTHGLTLDMTTSSETKVGGEYAGVSAEQTLTLEFGVETTDEQSEEKSQEGTNEAIINVDFEAEPHQYYLVTITKEHATSYQTFSINGVMDFDITIQMPGNDGARLGSHFPGKRVTVQGVQGYEQFVRGFDTSYPKMQGFYRNAQSRTRGCFEYVLNPDHRRIVVSGVNQAALESNADYRVENLGTDLPPHLDNLPVVEAGHVGN